MNSSKSAIDRIRERGQSIVEVALFFPVMIFLLAGVVEVSNLLITQNRVTTSARHAAGFGAANYDASDWAGTANAMGVVAINTVTETLDLSTDLWDVWSIRAKTNKTGDGFDLFESEHVYGTNTVIAASSWLSIEVGVKNEILSELMSTGTDSAANLEVVASIAYHDIGTILGLNLWQWTGLETIRGFTVMRVGRPAPYVGCPVLPISVRLEQPSIYPSNWTPGVPYLSEPPPTSDDLFPGGTGPNGGFEYPNPEPLYENQGGVTAPQLRTGTFINNVPGVRLQNAQRGYIYWAREEGESGGFGWLTWDGDNSASGLRESLSFYPLPPGNFMENYPGGPADTNTTGDPPFITGNYNGNLEPGEWLENSNGNIHSSVPELEFYVSRGIPVTIIVFDQSNGMGGSSTLYRYWKFAVVRIVGYSFQGTNTEKWIVFEFIRWGDKCVVE